MAGERNWLVWPISVSPVSHCLCIPWGCVFPRNRSEDQKGKSRRHKSQDSQFSCPVLAFCTSSPFIALLKASKTVRLINKHKVKNTNLVTVKILVLTAVTNFWPLGFSVMLLQATRVQGTLTWYAGFECKKSNMLHYTLKIFSYINLITWNLEVFCLTYCYNCVNATHVLFLQQKNKNLLTRFFLSWNGLENAKQISTLRGTKSYPNLNQTAAASVNKVSRQPGIVSVG